MKIINAYDKNGNFIETHGLIKTEELFENIGHKEVIVKFNYPTYHIYEHGTYVRLNACDSCFNIGLYEDLYITNCCKLCGGTNHENIAIGKWIDKKIINLNCKWYDVFRKYINTGYWELKNPENLIEFIKNHK